MIKLQEIRASYDKNEVLHGVNAAFLPGRVTGIIGPNGCGKSTLMRVAAGLHSPSSGQIFIDGVPLSSLRSHELARRIAYLPQSRNIPELSVLRMVLHGRFAYLSYPRRYRRQDYEAAQSALASTGISELASSPLKSLSGGQRQKVYIAMALAQDTQTVLMDKPTTYLDIKSQFEIMSMARHLAQMGKAVVMVLHDLNLVLRYADNVLLLHQGRVVAHGAPEDICRSGVLEECFEVGVHTVATEDGTFFYFCP